MYDVYITEVATGETRLCVMELDWGEGSEFWWSEGNMSCDGNRHTEFERTEGNEPGEHVCGVEAYRVKIVLEDGTVVYED